MDANENNKQWNILKYITIQITFPFARSDSDSELYIYRKTIEQIFNIEKEESLVHLGLDGSLYNAEVDELLCNSNNKKLFYPEIKLFYESTELDLPDISILAKVKHPVYYFKCGSRCFKGTNKQKLTSPPCYLDELKIDIIGDLHYIDMNRVDKKFDLLQLHSNYSSKEFVKNNENTSHNRSTLQQTML